MANVTIYTDGAAKGNPGRGGYGVVLMSGQHKKELSQGFEHTTNNRMELLSVIVGLESLTKADCHVTIYSDSKYVVDSVEKKWVFGWQKKGFKGKKNKDLWLRYLEIHPKFNLVFHWVKGHAGHIENERCDVLAFNAASNNPQNIDFFFEEQEK